MSHCTIRQRIRLYFHTPTAVLHHASDTSISPPICSDESHLLRQGFDESKGCPLGAAQQMVGRITETIGREHSDKVSMQKGHVEQPVTQGRAVADQWRARCGRAGVPCPGRPSKDRLSAWGKGVGAG